MNTTAVLWQEKIEKEHSGTGNKAVDIMFNAVSTAKSLTKATVIRVRHVGHATLVDDSTVFAWIFGREKPLWDEAREDRNILVSERTLKYGLCPSLFCSKSSKGPWTV